MRGRGGRWRPSPLGGAGAVVLLANGFGPLAWIVLTSFKSETELEARPLTWWPRAAGWANYARAFHEQPLERFLANSAVVAFGTALLALAVAFPAAYAFARLRFPGRRVLLAGFVAVAMCPAAALVVPLFRLMRGFGLLNTRAALILPDAVMALPVALLILIAQIRSVPVEAEEAARLFGCGRVRTLLRVLLPMTWPGIFTAALLTFVASWEEFLVALTLNAAPAAQTLPVGLILYQGEYTFPWPLISAAVVVALVPLLLVIGLFQSRIIGGAAAGPAQG